MNKDARGAQALARLVEVVAYLRGPKGCPWDRAQTHQTLVPYILEEAYEVAEALGNDSPEELKEELGDLLLQILLHSQIEAEAGHFTIADVAHALREKLVRRHPHVFGQKQADTPEAVRAQWEEIKKEDKAHSKATIKPALLRAVKYVEVREAQGDPVPVGELIRLPDRPQQPPEDLVAGVLLEAVALARKLGCDPELSLHKFLAKEGHG